MSQAALEEGQLPPSDEPHPIMISIYDAKVQKHGILQLEQRRCRVGSLLQCEGRQSMHK